MNLSLEAVLTPNVQNQQNQVEKHLKPITAHFHEVFMYYLGSSFFSSPSVILRRDMRLCPTLQSFQI